MKKTINIFILITILSRVLCTTIFASEIEHTDILPTKTFQEVLKLNSIDDIKYATIGYIEYPNNVYADINTDDIREFISTCWDIKYEVVIRPYNEPADFFINIWTDEKDKFNSNYRCKQTIYNTELLYGAYGNEIKSTGVAYAYNYIWYVPTDDSLEIIKKATENLVKKYIDKKREGNNDDGILVPSATPNYFYTDGCSQWADTELQLAATKNLIPFEIADNYVDGISREDFCKLATQLIVVLSETSSYDTVNSKEIQSVAEEIVNNKNLNNIYKNVSYTDVEVINYELKFLSALGIVCGTGDGKFEPKSYITREQAATILNRIATFFELEISLESSEYLDDIDISEWAKNSVYNMKSVSVMQGDEMNLFNPKQIYTKEQSIITIYRLFSVILKNIYNIM